MVEDFGPGRRYNINKEEEKIVIVEELVESDMEVRGDKRTFEIVREMGDSLEGIISIRLTADYPTNHLGVKVPILDTEVWISRDVSEMV